MQEDEDEVGVADQVASHVREADRTYVGSELGESFDSLSMVVGRYRVAGGGHGGLAVIGPVRMDYTKIIPGLRTFCSLMSEKLVDR